MTRGNFLYKRLGKQIMMRRKEKNLSQQALALLCEIDRTYLALIERGLANPTVKMLHKISLKLHVRLHKLFSCV